MSESVSEVAVAAAAASRTARRPVTLEWQCVVRGGACTQPMVVQTMTITTTDGDMRLAKASKTEFWVQKLAAGRMGKRGDLKRSQVFDMLRTKADEVQSSEVADDSQDTIGAGAPDADPMDALNDIAHIEVGDVTPKKKARGVKRNRAHITPVEMTERPLAIDPNAAPRIVRLMYKSTNSLWLHVDDVPWLVNYMMDELDCGGVPLLEPQATEVAVAVANSAVPDLNINWDFHSDTDQYIATFVAGPLQGTVVQSRITNLTAEKWASILPPRDVEFELADFDTRRAGLFLYVQQHCAWMLDQGVSDP